MKLVLYSGGHLVENVALNRACLDLCRIRRPRATFIPSSSDGGADDFKEFVDAFEALGVRDFIYFPVDGPHTALLADKALASDLIFLGGGNTFVFLRDLRAQRLLGALKRAVGQGAVLGGLSAGAILMTSDIGAATYPDFDCDDNYVGLKNMQSLGFLPFDFFPHYAESARYRKALELQSRRRKRPILAFVDGGGLVVDEGELRFMGGFRIFDRGRALSLTKGLRPKTRDSGRGTEIPLIF